MTWTVANIPSLKGKTAIVTGANTGVGYEIALNLAKKNATVILACRSQQRGNEALQKILSEQSKATIEVHHLDLSSLASVHAFAEDFNKEHDHLDLLVNNAGVMAPPFSTTKEGIELQIGVNHFSHFALTGLLLEKLNSGKDARIVTVSSIAHYQGCIDFNNFKGQKSYSPWREYKQSKLANIIFAIELQRRLRRAGKTTISVAAHPGVTSTDIHRHIPFLGFLLKLWNNDPKKGSLPILYAATATHAQGGMYYGPNGVYELRGYPTLARITTLAKNEETGRRLWKTSEQITGVHFLSNSPPNGP